MSSIDLSFREAIRSDLPKIKEMPADDAPEANINARDSKQLMKM